MKVQMQKGFTLIELMIVVAIIGILAAIAIPQYSDYTSRTRAASAMAELASIKTAVNMCIAETGKKTGCSHTNTNSGIPNEFTYTKNIISGYKVEDGVINATSGATDDKEAELTIILTPQVTEGSGNMVWENSGTICNTTRGLKAGQGDC